MKAKIVELTGEDAENENASIEDYQQEVQEADVPDVEDAEEEEAIAEEPKEPGSPSVLSLLTSLPIVAAKNAGCMDFFINVSVVHVQHLPNPRSMPRASRGNPSLAGIELCQ